MPNPRSDSADDLRQQLDALTNEERKAVMKSAQERQTQREEERNAGVVDFANEEGWWFWRETYSREDAGDWIPVVVTGNGFVFIAKDQEKQWEWLQFVRCNDGEWIKIQEPPDWEMPPEISTLESQLNRKEGDPKCPDTNGPAVSSALVEIPAASCLTSNAAPRESQPHEDAADVCETCGGNAVLQATQKQTIAQLEARVKNCEHENNQWRVTCRNRDNTVMAYSAEVASLKTERDSLRAENAKLKEGMATQKQICVHYEDQNDRLQQESAAMREALKNIKQLSDSREVLNVSMTMWTTHQLSCEALSSDAGKGWVKRESVEALCVACREYVTERDYQNVEACRKDQDRLEKAMLAALAAAQAELERTK